MASLLSLLQGSNVAVIALKLVALFSLISAILTAVGAFLQSIGDKVPGWLGSIISGIGSITHFINGIYPSGDSTKSSS